MKSRQWIILVLAAVCLEVGCAQPGGEPPAESGALGAPIQIKVGQTLDITGEYATITFVKVSEDSRCPSDVQCAWAGKASVLLNITKSGGGPGEVTLTLGGAALKAEVQADPFLIELRELNPYPITAIPIKPGDYVATLVVTRLQPAPGG